MESKYHTTKEGKKVRKGYSLSDRGKVNTSTPNALSTQLDSSQKLNSITSQAVLRNTHEKYENSINSYKLFLNDKQELPRLSILENYKQIMRIMTNSYVRSQD